MRRLWNWLREVAWINVIGVALLVAGIVVAVLAAWAVVWGFLAVTLVLAGIGILILGLRS